MIALKNKSIILGLQVSVSNQKETNPSCEELVSQTISKNQLPRI